ncbi:MAG: hypothetical protein IH936_10650 [Acidobacteria bacterium]|nr:hypothetical protein [Acidobacteriota bacterium]
MGEHAAVYGRPAVVAAVGLRTRVTASPVASGELELLLPDLGYREQCTWVDVLAYGDCRRELWRGAGEQTAAAAAADTDVIGSGDEAGFVKVAVAEAMRSLERSENSRLRPGLRVLVRSDVPVGSGFGSSASVAVAVGAALLGSLSVQEELSADDERIAAIALEAERRQHGQPSGVDHTAVIRGGVLSVTREGDSLRTSALPRPEWLQRAIRVYDTGPPAETTGEVVAAVRNLRDREPRGFVETLDVMESATSIFLGTLGEKNPPWPTLVDAVRSFEHCLEALEVVPPPVAEVVRRVEAAGGAAKISGAGSLSGSAAGSLIVLWPPEARVEADLEVILCDYRPLAMRLGADGLELRKGSDV